MKNFLLALLITIVSATSVTADSILKAMSLPDLEKRLEEIDAELKQLAKITLRGGTGSLGYRSKQHPTPNATERVLIELDSETLIDQVVMIPTLFRSPHLGIQAEGFPQAFHILAGTSHTTNIVASFTKKDHLVPRIAPLAIPFPPVKASWISIEATCLSPIINRDRYTLQLAEIMVFNGLENIALNQTIAESNADSGYWPPQSLTDGFGPYLMNSAQGPKSQTQLIRIRGGTPTLTIDLETSLPVNQINLHTADVSLSIPMKHFSNRAVPRHIRITGAKRKDFSDETLLIDHKQNSINDTGPIIMQRLPKTTCRYIKLSILDPRPIGAAEKTENLFAFSEIEILSNGLNVAKGKRVYGSPKIVAKKGALRRITDGRNYYGNILTTRDWLSQLATRHELERERPLIESELTLRYSRQKKHLQYALWLVAFLASGTVITGLIGHIFRLRAILKTRKRIAANLHDELGAKLHAIGLLSDLAKDEVDATGTREELSELVEIVEEIRNVTEKTGAAARYCTNMLECPGIYEDVIEEMKKTARHLLTDIDHEFIMENDASIIHLRRRAKIDIYLFYKECLTNVIRHSGATRVSTLIHTSRKEFRLTVTDNGCGTDHTIPPSLKRRSRFLHAKLLVEPATEACGTIITLIAKPCVLNFKKQG